MTTKRIASKLLIIALLGIGLFGCRGPREVAPARAPLSTADMALMEIHSNHADFDWFSSRFSGSVVWEGRTHPLGGTMRIRKDSAIYISVAPILGIEIARALITPDSVKLVNRLESTYYMGDLRILSTMFNADVDFYMLQALLTGNDFPNFRKDAFQLEAESPLIRLLANERYRTVQPFGQPIRQTLSIMPDNMRIRTNVVEQLQSGRVLRADYRRHESIQGLLFPVELALMFQDEGNHSNMEVTFNRTQINVPQNMQFSVPSRYTPVVLTP